MFVLSDPGLWGNDQEGIAFRGRERFHDFPLMGDGDSDQSTPTAMIMRSPPVIMDNVLTLNMDAGFAQFQQRFHYWSMLLRELRICEVGAHERISCQSKESRSVLGVNEMNNLYNCTRHDVRYETLISEGTIP